jgi:DNA polymerase I-like protein with 3'-5' exonuclease and polymerase domains
MRKAIKLDVPIVLDARCGKNWMELEKLDIKG